MTGIDVDAYHGGSAGPLITAVDTSVLLDVFEFRPVALDLNRRNSRERAQV